MRIYYTTDTDEEDLNSTVWSHKSVELNRDHPEASIFDCKGTFETSASIRSFWLAIRQRLLHQGCPKNQWPVESWVRGEFFNQNGCRSVIHLLRHILHGLHGLHVLHEFNEYEMLENNVPEQKKHRRRSLRRLDHHLHKHHAHKIESAHAYMHLKECDSGEEEVSLR